jgi:hypothetical protein
MIPDNGSARNGIMTGKESTRNGLMYMHRLMLKAYGANYIDDVEDLVGLIQSIRDYAECYLAKVKEDRYTYDNGQTEEDRRVKAEHFNQ